MLKLDHQVDLVSKHGYGLQATRNGPSIFSRNGKRTGRIIPKLHVMDSQTMAYKLELFVVEMRKKNRSGASTEIGISELYGLLRHIGNKGQTFLG